MSRPHFQAKLTETLFSAASLCGLRLDTSKPDHWTEIHGRLTLNSLIALETDLRAWLDWWKDCERPDCLSSATAVADYFQNLEVARFKPSTILRIAWSVNRFLSFVDWPDPATKLVIKQFRHTKSKAVKSEKPPRSWFGWKQVQACVDVADPQSPRDVRKIAILLVLYETMAKPHQIFGARRFGSWDILPLQKADFQRKGDGSGSILLRQRRLKSTREAYLSPLAVTWLQRWLDVRPEVGGALFLTSRGKPAGSQGWFKGLEALMLRAGLSPKNFSPNCLRRGTARDLLRAGTSIDDVRQAGQWSNPEAVLRLIDAPSRAQPLRHLATLHARAARRPADLFSGRGQPALHARLLQRLIPTIPDLFDGVPRPAVARSRKRKCIPRAASN